MSLVGLKGLGSQFVAGTISAAGVHLSNLDLISSIVVICVSVLLTGGVTAIVQKWLNKDADTKLTQETHAVVIQNSQALLDMKEKEVEAYRSRIDNLIDNIEAMKSKIDHLENTIAQLRQENARLILFISQNKLREFIQDEELASLFRDASEEVEKSS